MIMRITALRVGVLGLFVFSASCSRRPIQSSTLAFGEGPTYELPTEMCGDYFVAPVLIDGRGPYAFLLDSGTGTTVLDSSVASELGVRGRTDLQIGALDVRGARIRRSGMDDLSLALGRRIDGILGHPVFGDYLLTYDFEGDRILLEDGSLGADARNVIPTSGGTRPFVEADVYGRSVSILIDTGSSRGLTLVDLDELDFSEPVQITGARMRIDGLHLVESGRLVGSATLGPMVLDEPIVHESVSVDLIGQRYLTEYNLTFDQNNALMRFDRIGSDGNAPITTAPIRGTGVVVAPVEDSWQVIHVDPEAEFEDAALEPGDTVTILNGRPLSARTCPAPGASSDVREWNEYVVTHLEAPVRVRIRTLVR